MVVRILDTLCWHAAESFYDGDRRDCMLVKSKAYNIYSKKCTPQLNYLADTHTCASSTRARK